MGLLLKVIPQNANNFYKICSKSKYLVINNSLKAKPFYDFTKDIISDIAEFSYKKVNSKKTYNFTKEMLEKLILEGKSTPEIAKIYGCSNTTINTYFRKFGVHIKHDTGISISDNVLRAQVAEGMSLPQMAKANNCSQSTIRRRMNAIGLCTLEAEKVANIQKEDLERLVSAGYSCSRIAKKYKVTELQLGRLLKEFGLETETEKTLKMITKQDILDLYEAGASYTMLPEIFGVPESFIYNLLKEFNLVGISQKISKSTAVSVDINFEMLNKMVKAGMTKTQIAEEIGVSVACASKYLDEYGILPIQRQAKTVLPDNFSLSQMLKKGATLEDIAEDYDISIEVLRKHIKKVLGYIPKKTSS